MTPISKLVLDQVETALAHSTTGLNARIAALASSYGITPYAFDFSSVSTNYFRASIDPQSLVDAQFNITLPALCLYATSANSRPETNRTRFEGDVTVTLDFGIEFPSDFVEGNFDKWGHVLEEALTELLYDAQDTGQLVSPVYYDGRISWNLYKLAADASNWYLPIRFQVSFIVAY